MASVPQVRPKASFSQVKYLYCSTLGGQASLHIWGWFQSANNTPGKSHSAEGSKPAVHVNGSKRKPNSLMSQRAKSHGFGKSRRVLGLE